jgi:hypothetical protein
MKHLRRRAAAFAALCSEHQIDEFRHLASRAHDERVCLIAFFPALIEVTATRHLKAAPFALDGMQTANVPGDPLSLSFHGGEVTTGVGQRLSALRRWERPTPYA